MQNTAKRRWLARPDRPGGDGKRSQDVEQERYFKETPDHLTSIEYRLLAYLITHPDSVLPHRQRLQNVWGLSHTEDSYVRVYKGALRKKIEDDLSQPKYFMTEVDVGYRFIA